MVINVDADIYEFLSDMQKDVFHLMPVEFEEKWYKICCELASIAQAKKIHDIDFSSYKKELSEKFISVFDHEYFSVAKAIYFEYDLYNEWQSGFFICNEYNPAVLEDEDWACDWAGDSVEGPDFPMLTSIYDGNFDRTLRAKGITLYLVARTVSSFIEVLKHLPSIEKTICIAFHDQTPIMRVQLSNCDL